MRIPLLVFTILLLVPFSFISSQCSIDQSTAIPDLTPVSANLIIGGLLNDDLSSNQAVCGVTLEFEHEQVGDLTIELVSPSGQTVTLIGPTGSYGNTSFTDWEVSFLPCSQSASPDAGFLTKWNNDQSWGILGDYTGSYHPYLGCMEDFNSGSANGIWSINILDNTQFDVGTLKNASIFFCDPTGLNCNVCEAYAGEFEVSSVNVCLSDPSNVSLNPIYPNGNPGADYNYYYVISQGNSILEITDNLDMTGYGEAVYSVCGLSISLLDEGMISDLASGSLDQLQDAINGPNPSVCGDLTNDCVSLILAQSPTSVDLDITICDGSQYNLGGDSFSNPGQYEVNVPQSNGCDSIYNLNLSTVTLNAEINTNTTILDCVVADLVLDGGNSTFTNDTEILWTTNSGGFTSPTDQINVSVNQAGSYTLTLKEGFCTSVSTIQITEDEDAPDITLSGGTITCANPEVQIDFNSTETINSFDWVGPNGFVSNIEDPTVEIPGEYTVTIVSANGCISSKSVIINQAGDVPTLDLQANSISCSQPQVIINVASSSNSLTYEWTGPNGFTFSGKNPIVGIAGTYFVQATDPFGCVGYESIIITGSSESLTYEIDFGVIECSGGSTFLKVEIDDPNAFVSWTLPNNSEKTGAETNTNIAGTHILKIISNGCMVLDTFTVVEDYSLLPDANPFQENIIDCTNQSTVLHTNVISNLANVDYITWSGPETSVEDSVVQVYISGVYSTRIYTKNGCVLRYDHNLIFDNEVPNSTIEKYSLTCDNPNQRLVATASEILTYQWTGPNGFTSQDSLIEFIPDGEYKLTIADVNGCERSYIRNISTDTLPYKMNAFVSDVLNCDIDSVNLNLERKAVINPEWSDNTGVISNDISTKITTPGLYYISAFGQANGCPTFDTVEVLQDIIEPDLTAMDQGFDCGQSTLVLSAESATPNVIFEWTGPNGYYSNTQNPIVTEPGSYECKVTGLNGCTTSEMITVLENNALPDIGANSSNDLDCINTTSVLTGTSATSNVTFRWEGPLNVYNQPVISVDVPGDYQFIVTGDNECSDSITINVPFTGSYPEFEAIGDTLFCNESNSIIDVQEITNNVTYEWTGPNGYFSNDKMNSVTEEGMYIVFGTGQNNCVTVDTTFLVIDNEDPEIVLISNLDTLDCNLTDLSLEFETDKDLSTINWTGPNGFTSSNLDLNVSEGGTYNLVFIAENDCEANYTIEIEQNISLPEFILNADTINCDNNKAEITLDNNDDNATYSWSGSSFSSNLQSPTVEESGEYLVTVTGSNGCVKDSMVNVYEDLLKPDLTVKDDTLPCDGSPIEIFAMTNTDNVTYQWVGPNGFDTTDAAFFTDVPGNYFIEITGANGCSANETVNLSDIPVFPEFNISKLNDINCYSLETEIRASDVTDDKSFVWTGPDDFTSSDSMFITSEAGMYYIQVEGLTGCVETDSILIELDTMAPDINVTKTGKLLCEVNEVSISGVGSSTGPEFSYFWSSQDGEITFGSNSLDPKISGEGQYQFLIFNEENGCRDSITIKVEEEESTLDGVSLLIDKQTCTNVVDGEIIVANVFGGIEPYRYAIEGISFSTIDSFPSLESGDYLLSVKDSFGCIYDTIVNVGLSRNINVDLGEDINIDLGETITLEANTNLPPLQIAEMFWTPSNVINCGDCLDFTFQPDGNMIATVYIEDFDGCSAEDKVIIRVNEAVNLYVPNIFTPNQDGQNDLFEISKSKNVEEVVFFNIYDRWGSVVFSDENFVPGQGKSWDGTHRGQSIQEGVYVYVAELQMVNGKTEFIRGNITVLR